LDTTRSSRPVTKSASGDVDLNGDIVGEFARQVAATRGPLEGRYVERSGLDDRVREAGGDPATLRRMLRVPA
jgi:hypothetical protein